MTGRLEYPKDISLEWRKKYSRARAQARFRKQEWAFSCETWYELWRDSGLIEHRGKELHSYCMVRKDPIEAWSPKNCIIASRRQFFKKCGYESLAKLPKTDWADRHDQRNKQ